jgi:hypothetical protein
MQREKQYRNAKKEATAETNSYKCSERNKRNDKKEERDFTALRQDALRLVLRLFTDVVPQHTCDLVGGLLCFADLKNERSGK